MKKFQIIILFFLFIQYNSYSQNFIDTSKVWTVSERIFDGSKYLNASTIQFHFETDSLVNDLKYTKMYQSRDHGIWQFHSLWREDDNGNIFYQGGISKETLYYNFGLNAGDSILLEQLNVKIDSTRFQLFGNGLRKFIYAHYLETPEHIIIWVEGVGSLISPNINDDYFLVGGLFSLICFEENGEHIYLNPAFTACDAGTGTTVSSIHEKIELIKIINFRNGEIQIDILNDNVGEITFYNTQGKKVLHENISTLIHQLCIPISGVLLYHFTSEKGEVQTGKIWVN